MEYLLVFTIISYNISIFSVLGAGTIWTVKI